MNTTETWLSERLVCPRDGTILERMSSRLRCASGHEYPVVRDIPVILRDDVEQTAWWTKKSLDKAWEYVANADCDSQGDKVTHSTKIADERSTNRSLPNVDEHVQRLVAATSGYLYQPLVGKLKRYPIPELRLPDADNNQTFLDVGCNWGRWSVAAAKKGYRVVGIDPSLDGVLAAKRVTEQLGVEAAFVVADARYLPFQSGVFDTAFSYSVIQHFSKENAAAAVREAARVVRPKGTVMIQMPNWLGIRSLYHQAKRGFREGKAFDVRYWSLPELKKSFTEFVGTTELSVDGYFGLGIQKADIDLLPLRYRMVVNSSELLRGLSKKVGWMKYFADSIYVTSERK